MKESEAQKPNWEAMLLAVCAQGEQVRAKCHAEWPGLCNGKDNFCGACNRVKQNG